MKAFQLLQIMEEQEHRQLSLHLQKHPRKRLSHLLQFLLENLREGTAKPDKKELFERLWEESYHSNKDYLLRNEARLLYREIKTWLAIEEFGLGLRESTGVEELWFLKALQRKNANKLFDVEYRRAVKRLEGEGVPEQYRQLLALNFLQLTKNKASDLEITMEKVECTQKLLEQTRLSATRNLRRAENKEKYARFMAMQHGIDQALPPVLRELDLEKTEDSFTHYLHCRARIWHSRGAEKLKIWEEALSHLDHAKAKNEDLITERFIVLTNMALENFLGGNFREADSYYQRLFALGRQEKRSIQTGVWFNYYSNLIRLKEYGQAVKVFSEQREHFKKSELFWIRSLCLQAMCYLFMSQGREALSMVPYDFQKHPETQANYFRLILCTAYFLKGDLDTALREIRNFIQTLSYRDEQILDVKKIAIFYRRYFSLFESTKTKKKQDVKQLSQDLHTYITGQMPPLLKDYLPLIWLSERIEMEGAN